MRHPHDEHDDDHEPAFHEHDRALPPMTPMTPMTSLQPMQAAIAPQRPQPQRRDDEDILEELWETLDEDGHLDGSDVDIRVADGAVILRGTVLDPADKDRLEEVAWHTDGVVDVVNALRVRLV